MAKPTKQNGKNSPPKKEEDEYTSAVETVVDDRMRTDVLGPYFCTVIEDHTPASTKIVALIAKEIAKDPELKKAVKEVVDERNGETKMRWVDRAIGVGGTILLAVVIWGIQNLISSG